MQRAHTLPSAKEHLFIDSTSSCDPGHHSLTFLLTACSAGSIPLGLLITKGQTTAAYSKGFSLFQKCAAKFAFGNQGYPTTILTDNSAAEIAAIKETWPNSAHFLCVFHILQAVWRWLYNTDNKIHHDDRTRLMIDFKRILRAQDCVEIQIAYETCLENGAKYPQWIKYINEYWAFKEKWALAYRDEKIRGHHTNNFSEANIRIFKDVVLSRVKAYNVISLVDFCATGLEQYHVTKLRDFANFRSRKSYLFFQNCLKKIQYFTADGITPINNHLFLVPSESNAGNTYTVDCEIGVCSCPEGQFGKFCKHQCAIFRFFDLPFVNFPPITQHERYMMAKVALGEKQVPHISFYEDFLEENPETERNPLDLVETFVTEPSNNENVGTASNLIPNKDNLEIVSQVTEDTNELRDSIVEILTQNINSHEPCLELNTALKVYKKRLQAITTNGLLLQFLHTAGMKSDRIRNLDIVTFQKLCVKFFGEDYDLPSTSQTTTLRQPRNLAKKHFIEFNENNHICYNNQFQETLHACVSSDKLETEPEYKLLYGPRMYSVLLMKRENILDNDGQYKYSFAELHENLDFYFIDQSNFELL